MKSYRIYDLEVRSDLDLGLPLRQQGEARPAAAELAVRGVEELGAPIGELVHRAADFAGGPLLEVYAHGQDLDLSYDGWRIALRGEQVEIAEEGAHRSELTLVFERIVAPLALLWRREGVVGLHGGAIALDGRAWLIIGPSGVGKSTTALELVRRGAALIADDLTIADAERRSLLPGAPTLRLWRGAGELQEAMRDAPIAGDTAKRWFRLSDRLAAPAAAKLVGLVVLEPGAASTGLGLACEQVGGADGLATMLEQTFDLSEPTAAWRRARFAAVAQLARHTPMWRVRYARDLQGRPTHVDPLWELLRGEGLSES